MNGGKMFGIVPDNRLADLDAKDSAATPQSAERNGDVGFSPREQEATERAVVPQPRHERQAGEGNAIKPQHQQQQQQQPTSRGQYPLSPSVAFGVGPPTPHDIHKHVAPDEHDAIQWHRRFMYVLCGVGVATLCVAIALVVNLATELDECATFAASERALIVSAVYNPVQPNAWRAVHPLTPMPGPRFYAAACVLGSNLYVVGGITGTAARSIAYAVYADVWVFAEGTDTWQSLAVRGVAPLPTARYLATLTDAGGGYLLLYGGFNSHPDVPGHTALGDMFLLDASTNSWSPLSAAAGAAVPSARGGHAAVGYQGVLYMTGGASTAAAGGAQPFHELWSFRIATRMWTALSMDAGIATPGGRLMASLGHAPDSTKLFLTGGSCRLSAGGAASVCGSTWVYDRTDNAWTLLPSSTTTPAKRTAATVASGVSGNDIAFSFGGRSSSAECFTANEDVELFGDLNALDVPAVRWMPMVPNFNRSGSVPPPTSGHTLVRIGQRIVLFGGQVSSTGDPGSAQLWKYQALTPRP